VTDSSLQVSISVTGLGKRYDIEDQPGSSSLYDRMAELMTLRRNKITVEHSHVWALRDVTFEVPTGHVLGVLGRNGSGKSTLMKILARVTSPTTGRAEVHGRVGALLQVGTGFHPELSGRENIELSGAIMGMSRKEVAAVRDRIIDFAEVGRFLDTPVKHYSSGMYLRLAFSVAAHLDAEIMLVDEVLSVGDISFQRKCTERIRALVRDGRTVLFVSHSMPSVLELCDSALVLVNGHVQFNGSTQEAVAFYQSPMAVAPLLTP